MFEGLPPEYIGGFVSGVLATLLGFGLTIIWDSIKYYRDRKKKDEAILSTLHHEIQGNIDILRRNKELVNNELESLKSRKYYITPLSPLHESMWRIIGINMPKKLVDSPELLEKLRIATQDTMHAIEVMESREGYRLNNSNMTNFNDRMKSYDEILSSIIPRLIRDLEEMVQLV